MGQLRRFADIEQFTRSGSYAADYSPVTFIAYLDELQNEQGFDLDPYFQRPHVWTTDQQVAFIEFFLRGGLTGRDIYLNDPDWQRPNAKRKYVQKVLVDGKQRIQAWRRFLNNEIRVFGSLFSEFEDKLNRSVNTIRLCVNDLQTEAEVLKWYLEFNAGGTPHTKKELQRVRQLLEKQKKKAE